MPDITNIKDLVYNYLKTNGYDGLAGDECGCSLDELFACDSTDISKVGTDCIPGYNLPVRPDGCPAGDIFGGCMSIKKNAVCKNTDECPY